MMKKPMTAKAPAEQVVKDLRAEALALKELVADLNLENRFLNKNMSGAGETANEVSRCREA